MKPAAMILCAGLGTRLSPLTEVRPKPLVPVGDRPALAHVVARVRPIARAIVVNAHHRAADVAAYARPLGIAVSEETELLGTAGGVARAAALLGEGDVVVWNGDVLADFDPSALLDRRHEEATLAIRPRAASEGNVGVDGEGRVVRLRKETTAPGEIRGGEFLGVHRLGAALRADLPERGCLVGDVYLPALRAGARLGVAEHEGPWWDVGTIDQYLDANVGWLGAREAWCGEGAEVAAAVALVRSVVGAGAIVEGEGALEACVVWPGARAIAPARRRVFTA